MAAQGSLAGVWLVETVLVNFLEALVSLTEDKSGALTGPRVQRYLQEDALSAPNFGQRVWWDTLFLPQDHGCRGTCQKATGGGHMLHLPRLLH